MSKKVKEESIPKEIKSELISCLNCETPFKGNYCPNCGQSVFGFEKPFKFLIVDFAGNLFAFDTRFWKSLVSLIIRPGEFTSDYIKGHRARYMPPFRLYVFVSFIFFLLLSLYFKKNVQINEEDRLKINTAIDSQRDSNRSAADSTNSYNYTFGNEKGKFELSSNIKDHLDSNLEEADSLYTKDLNIGIDENEKLGRAILMVVNNPGIYINSFLKFLSWSLFILMPVYACFLWLFFRRSRTYYFSHLIFAINQHTFAFLLFIFILGLSLIFPNRDQHPEVYIAFSIPIYIYIGCMKFYKRRWHTTLFRMFSVLFFYLFTIALALGIILVIWAKSEFL